MKREVMDSSLVDRRLRVFDWNSRWFWIVVLWEARRLRASLYGPQTWGRWVHVWTWEAVPDRRGVTVPSGEAE